MRVLFINTQDLKGGAAIVVDRMRRVLQEDFKAETRLIVGNKISDRRDVLVTREGFGAALEKGLHKITNMLGLQYQFFPVTAHAILQQVRDFRPDIISLHNSHGGYFQTSLLKDLSRYAPIVWTLHDMWSFTGNSAHTFGDVSWKSLQNADHLTKYYPSIGINTGAWLLRQKRRIYTETDMTIVTPSKWLQTLASQSPVFKGKEVCHINNGVDLDVFSPESTIDIRGKLGIGKDDRVIMFSSEKLNDGTWKGGNDLLKILQHIDNATSQKIHLLMIGQGMPEDFAHFSRLIPHFTGYIQDEFEMAAYLTASDVFLYPTKADNLPNVLVEAIACGTPCVTFDIGGCGEIVVDQESGYVVKPQDFPAIVKALLVILGSSPSRRSKFRSSARRIAEEKFSVKRMGAEYYKIFQAQQRNV